MKRYLLLLVIAACSTPKEPADNSTSSFASDTIFVTSFESKLESLNYPIKSIGKVRSKVSSKLIFEGSGILKHLNIGNGERVRKGTLIATLKNRVEYLRKEQAQIDLDQAMSVYENERLKIRDSVEFGEGWGRVREKLLLNSGVSQAQIRLDQAKHDYNRTFIKAPFSGVLEGVTLRPGDFVTAGTEIGSMYDPNTYEVESPILEYDLLKLAKGMKVRVFPLSDSNIELSGTLGEINPAVDRTGQSRVLINLKDNEGIIPGLSVRVEINVSDQPTIVIPMEAVVNRSDRHVVFNVENNLAKWNYVTLGKNNGKHVQILEGLSEGMEVIVSNNLQLAHDSPIRTR